ncbi:MAG: thiamine diphosphokinase [Peptostreptococcaceae bacterium]|nr:thiamine diphosphokinase [Peptostreptococcaceae bacterium]
MREKKEKKACIVLNGQMRDFAFYRDCLDGGGLIIAADGAANTLFEMGISPHCIIGDMDSIKERVYAYFEEKGAEILRYPARKNKTDSELAIDLAAERGCREIRMLGCFGDRIDHSLGNLYLLHYAREQGLKAEILSEEGRLFLIGEGESVLDVRKGDTVSFLNIGSGAEGIDLEGFEYPLENYDLALGSTRCISNVAVQEHPKVRLRRGSLLAVISGVR